MLRRDQKLAIYMEGELIGDFAKMNAVYSAFFPDPRPTRTTVEVARLVNDARVEITSVAVRGRGGRSQ